MINIAVVQLKTMIINRSEIVEYYIKEASKSADIIVFPEYVMTDQINKDNINELANKSSSYKNIFIKLAKKYNIDIVSGSILEKRNSAIFNTAYYIDSKGKVKGNYDKINLWHSERKLITQGNKISVFNTKHGKIGLSICWDLIHPELYRSMAKNGVQIVFCMARWYRGDNIS